MLRTTALPQAAADQPGLTKHDAAIFHTRSRGLTRRRPTTTTRARWSGWTWLDLIEAIGDRLPEEHQRKRATWALAQGRVV
jgi:hypothetical protein